MGTSRSETHRVMPRMEALPEQTRMLLAPDLVSSLTKGMKKAWTPGTNSLEGGRMGTKA